MGEHPLSYQEDSINWQAVEDIDLWLDAGAGPMYQQQALAQDWARVAKIQEETGEAIAELILYTGQNPRKGTQPEAYKRMLNELADVTATAILAIQHFTKNSANTRDIIREKITAIEKRKNTAIKMALNSLYGKGELQ